MPLRAGQAAAVPGRPRRTTRVRVKLLTGAVQGQEMLQHRGQQIQPADLPGARLEFQRHVEAAAEGAGAAGRAGGAGRGGDADERLDRGAGFRGFAQVVEPQHLLQRGRAVGAAGDRQMAERQMRHQPPEAVLAQRRAQRRGRRGDRVERATAAAPSTSRSVGWPPPNGRSVGRSRLRHSASTDSTGSPRGVRIEVGVVRRQEDLGAGHAGRGRAPGDVVEAARRRPGSRIVVGQPVERPPRPERAVRQGLAHPLDAPDLRRPRPARIRHDAVFGVGVGQRDRLAALAEQIDHRRAAERQAAGRWLRSSSGDRAVEIDENLQPVAAGHHRLRVDPGEVEEQELFREGEIFGQQAEAGEAARGPRQQRLLGREAGRLDRGCRHDDRRGVDRGVGVGDRDRVAAQQFVQRQRLVRRPAQEEAQPVDAQLGEGRLGRGAFQRDAQHADGAGGGRIGGCDERQAGQPDVLHLDRPQRHGAVVR